MCLVLNYGKIVSHLVHIDLPLQISGQNAACKNIHLF